MLVRRAHSSVSPVSRAPVSTRFSIYVDGHRGYPALVTKRLVDIEDDVLAAARVALATTTIKETVNKALAESAAGAARRRFMERMLAHGLPDLDDPGVTSDAWR